ncbi:hypothetical protein NSQ59_02735 [Margalitia sp. FSL K6-0131]
MEIYQEERVYEVEAFEVLHQNALNGMEVLLKSISTSYLIILSI